MEKDNSILEKVLSRRFGITGEPAVYSLLTAIRRGDDAHTYETPNKK